MTDFDSDLLALRMDVETVFEKVKLVREMMAANLSLQDGLGDVVGFLEACMDRLPDLIKAGSEGVLSEDMFARVLQLNDALQSTLEAERTGTLAPDLSFDQPSSSAPTSAPTSKVSKISPPYGGNGQRSGKTNKAHQQQKEPTLAEQMAGVSVSVGSTGSSPDPPPVPMEAMSMGAPAMAPIMAPRPNSLRPPSAEGSQQYVPADASTTGAGAGGASSHPPVDPFGGDLSMSPFHGQLPPPAPAATKATNATTNKALDPDEDFEAFLKELDH